MPSKGRSNPCSNPMNRKHKKETQYKDVFPVSVSQVAEYKNILPEYRWDDETRMCGTCRSMCNKQVKAREKVLDAADDIRRILQEDWDDSDDDALFPLHQQMSPKPAADVCSSESDVDETNLRTRYGSTGEQELTSKSRGSRAPVANEDFRFLTPSAPSEQPVECGGTSSGMQNRLVLSTPSTGTCGTGFGTPSSWCQSSPGGSLFHDEETAKIDLHHLLEKLGVTPPNKSVASSRKRFSCVFGKASKAMKTLFRDYTGEDVPDSTCECSHCKKLFTAVKTKLPLTTSKKEKYMMLTSLPNYITIQTMHKELNISQYSARLASFLRNKEGPFSFPMWKQMGRSIPDAIKSIVIDFYNSDDNSRVSPAARDTRTVTNMDGERITVPKRLMLAGLKETFRVFKSTQPNVKLGLSSFAELRPKNCKWHGFLGVHESCTCIIHQNFLLMLEGLKNASVEGIEKEFEEHPSSVSYLELLGNHKELIKYLICDNPTEECYMGYCETCPNEIHIQEILEFSNSTDITYKFWSSNDICVRVDEHSQFSDNFYKSFVKFLVHDYIYEIQKEYIKVLKNGPLDNGTSGVLTVDFGENYSFIVQNAVQGFHGNNKQAIVHPFVLYTASNEVGKSIYKTYFVISDEMGHDATSFHCFRGKVIEKIKNDFPNLTSISYVSDGAGSQYKNFKNISNLLFHKEEYNLTADWVFTATGHGKSTCDAMSAVVKRTVRLRSLKPGSIITTPLHMFEIANRDLASPTLEFLYVTKEDVDFWRNTLQGRYKLLEKVPSIRQNHYFAVSDNQMLICKRFAKSEKYEQHCLLKELGNLEESMDVDQNAEQQQVGIGLAIGSFYAVYVGKSYQIGCVTEEVENDGLWRMQMMKKTGRGGTALLWPPVCKFQDVCTENVIIKIETPEFNEKGQNYRLHLDDLAIIKNSISLP